MSMHNVRFQSKAGLGSNYRLLCEIDNATNDPEISTITFLNELAVANHLRAAGLEWDSGGTSQMMFGRWFYVSSKQLERLGFRTIPAFVS